ncbi:MAG: SAP domain-containing protein [Colwellia sp.]|nr:SAP domain-containing protein [Colwellia sp.]
MFVSDSPGSIIQTIQDNISEFVSKPNYRNPTTFEDMFKYYGNLDQIKNYIVFISTCTFDPLMIENDLHQISGTIIGKNGSRITKYIQNNHVQYITQCKTENKPILIQNIISSNYVNIALKNGFLEIVDWCMSEKANPDFRIVYNLLNLKIFTKAHEQCPDNCECILRNNNNPKHITIDDILATRLCHVKSRYGYTLLSHACCVEDDKIALKLISSGKFEYGKTNTLDQSALFHSIDNLSMEDAQNSTEIPSGDIVANAILDVVSYEINQLIKTEESSKCHDILTLACMKNNETLALKIVGNNGFDQCMYLSAKQHTRTMKIMKIYIMIFNMRELDSKLAEFYDDHLHLVRKGMCSYSRVFEDVKSGDVISPNYLDECEIISLTKTNIINILWMFRLVIKGNKVECICRIKKYVENKIEQSNLDLSGAGKFTRETLKMKTIPLLKNILREKGLNLSGRKQDLIDRIFESQR